MFAGRSVHWVQDREVAWQGEMADRIDSTTSGARSTKHAIVVEGPPTIWRGGWLLQGGLLGRAELPEATVELFGRGNVRLHWPYDSKVGEDYTWDFFLLVRDKTRQEVKLVRRWSFGAEEIVLAAQPPVAASIRKTAGSEEEAIRLINKQKSYYLVAAQLSVDSVRRIAAVKIQGIVRCIDDQINLAPVVP